MPIREYRCNECGFQFETIDLGQDSVSEPDKVSCPNCGSMEVGKKISLFVDTKGDGNSRRLG